jgi:hypothetical protein
MTRREVRFLWAGLVVGFMLGAVTAVISLAHMFGGSWAGGVSHSM